MTNCKEFVLDDATAITAFPVADVPAGTAAWQLHPVISRTGDGFSPTLSRAVTIGQWRAAYGGTAAAALIPIRRNTGKARDSEGDGVEGRLHTVSVSCQVDDRDPAVWARLLSLERTPSHLLLTFRDGTTQAFVAATRDTYVCNVERDGAKTSVTFRIQCVMGIQLMA